MDEDAKGTTDRAPGRVWTRDFLLLSTSTLFCFASLFAIAPNFPLYIERVGHGSDVQIGLIMGAFTVSSILLRPLVGRLSDRKGRKTLLLAGSAILVASSLLYMASRDLVSMSVVQALRGAGFGCFHTLSLSMVGDKAPVYRRGESMSLFMAFSEVGTAIGPPLGLLFLNSFGFNQLFLFAGLLAVLSLGFLVWVPETRIVEVVPAAGRDRGSLKASPVILASVAIFCEFFPVGTALSFLAVYAEQEAIPQYALYFTISSFIVVLLRVAGGKVPDALGHRFTPVLFIAITGLGMIVLAYSHSFVGLAIAGAANGLGFSFAVPSLTALLTDRVPAESLGIAFGIATSFIDVGVLCGSVMMGFVASSMGLGAAFWISGIVTLSGALFYLLFYAPLTSGESS